jgi:hypothetical protein
VDESDGLFCSPIGRWGRARFPYREVAPTISSWSKAYTIFHIVIEIDRANPPMTRQSIINSFRQAIAAGDRNKISKTDFDELIDDFVEQLAELKSKAKIKALCAAELALLEEGYPQACQSLSPTLSQSH